MEDGRAFPFDPTLKRIALKDVTVADAEREAIFEDYEANGPL
jgi:hypothetical protein